MAEKKLLNFHAVNSYLLNTVPHWLMFCFLPISAAKWNWACGTEKSICRFTKFLMIFSSQSKFASLLFCNSQIRRFTQSMVSPSWANLTKGFSLSSSKNEKKNVSREIWIRIAFSLYHNAAEILIPLPWKSNSRMS